MDSRVLINQVKLEVIEEIRNRIKDKVEDIWDLYPKDIYLILDEYEREVKHDWR